MKRLSITDIRGELIGRVELDPHAAEELGAAVTGSWGLWPIVSEGRILGFSLIFEPAHAGGATD